MFANCINKILLIHNIKFGNTMNYLLMLLKARISSAPVFTFDDAQKGFDIGIWKWLSKLIG